MSNEEQMRSEFEAWCETNIFPQSWKDDNGAWKMWQIKQREIDELTQRVQELERSDYHASCRRLESKLTQQVLELSAQVEVMRDALVSILPWVVTQVVACHGLKCREPVCESCSGDAETNAQDACAAYCAANAVLASIEPSVALRAHVDEEVAKALEEAAAQFEEEDEHLRVGDCTHTYAKRLREIANERRKR